MCGECAVGYYVTVGLLVFGVVWRSSDLGGDIEKLRDHLCCAELSLSVWVGEVGLL